MRGVYIHIPFCASICSYCDFPKFLANPNFYTSYLNALKKEIKERYEKDTVKTIYIGGGTPSALDLKSLEHLFDILKKIKRTKDAEITIECNVNDLTEDKIKLFKKFGINRVSIGVQTLNESLLKLLNRNHTFYDLKKAVDLLRGYGINNINFDLIYAIPTQTLDDLKLDLQELLSLKPNHISAYSLIIEPHTLLYIKNIQPISEELDHAMYEYVRIFLKGKGYVQYEISNYAKPNFKSSHNLIYWNYLEYYGFGLGATSYLNQLIITNTKSLNDYLAFNYELNNQPISVKEQMSYFMILGLRKRSGVSSIEFKERFGIEITEVFDLTDLELKEDNYYLNEKDVYICNDILTKFII